MDNMIKRYFHDIKMQIERQMSYDTKSDIRLAKLDTIPFVQQRYTLTEADIKEAKKILGVR